MLHTFAPHSLGALLGLPTSRKPSSSNSTPCEAERIKHAVPPTGCELTAKPHSWAEQRLAEAKYLPCVE